MVMTHHTAKANLEKGSSWPPEVIPYRVSPPGYFHMTNLLAPHVGPGQDGLVLPEPPDHSIIKKGYIYIPAILNLLHPYDDDR